MNLVLSGRGGHLPVGWIAQCACDVIADSLDVEGAIRPVKAGFHMGHLLNRSEIVRPMLHLRRALLFGRD